MKRLATRSAGPWRCRVAAGEPPSETGYLVWQWLREDAAPWVGAVGGLVLVLYGVVPTFQPAHFGRVYAAYGGVFVVGSLLWGWWIDGRPPDGPDVIGGLLCLGGVGVLMYWPRG